MACIALNRQEIFLRFSRFRGSVPRGQCLLANARPNEQYGPAPAFGWVITIDAGDTGMDAESTGTGTPRLTRAQVDELADQIAVCSTKVGAAIHQLLTLIRQFDLATGWARQGAKSCAYWLSWRTGLGLVAAREKVRVANARAR